LDVEIVSRLPGLVAARLRLAEARLVALEQGAGAQGPCADRARCEREIEEQARAVMDLSPNASSGALVLARLRRGRGDVVGAAELLDKACALPEGRTPCLKLRVELAAKDDAHHLDALVRDLASSACTEPHSCASVSQWIGDFRAARGEWNS